MSVGANAVIARMVGSGNKDQIGKSVHTSIAIAVLSGAIIMIVGEWIQDMTKKRFSKIFKTPETSKTYSGRFVSPPARNIAASKL